jgi:glycosyltransferase involved in cell wall biosynthesis
VRLTHLAFASGKSLFPIGEGGGETIAHDLLSGLHYQGYQPEATGVIDLKHVSDLNAALVELNCDLEVNSIDLEIMTYSGRRLLCPSEPVFRYQLTYPISLTLSDNFLDYFEKQLSQDKFQCVLFQAERSPELLEMTHRKGVYSIFYAQNGLELRWFKNPQSLPLVLSNSKFYQERLRQEYGVNCELLYPAIELDRYLVSENSHEYITMINPVVVKGIVPFLALALALPNRKFLVVEGWGTPTSTLELINRIPNVTYMKKQVDMRSVYGKTHILVVPSQWEEAFGRVIVEAQINGIPVLASEVGGIPEAVGHGGVLVRNFRDLKAWLKALGDLEMRYDELSSGARINAERFSVKNAVACFLDIINSIDGY